MPRSASRAVVISDMFTPNSTREKESVETTPTKLFGRVSMTFKVKLQDRTYQRGTDDSPGVWTDQTRRSSDPPIAPSGGFASFLRSFYHVPASDPVNWAPK